MAVDVVGDLTLGVAFGVAGTSLSTSLSLVLAVALSVASLPRRHVAVSVPDLTAAVAGWAARRCSLDSWPPAR